MSNLSDFLGRIFFTRPNELNFCMWPSISLKNIAPYFSLLVSLSFSTNNVCKNAGFSWWNPFQTKLLFFQTRESAKHAFAAMASSGEPAFLHALFLENEKQNSRKNYTAMFSLSIQGHMRKI